MKVLRFSEYFFESHQNDFSNDVEKFLEDGYKIKASRVSNKKKIPGVINFSESPNSFCLSFDTNSNSNANEVWLPKESVDLEEHGENLVIVIHPERKWITNKKNRESLEDFLEDFIDYKSNFDVDSSVGKEVEDDLYTILDILDLPLEIENIEKRDPKNFSAVLKNGQIVDLVKGPQDNLFSRIEFFSGDNRVGPILILDLSENNPRFECFSQDFDRKNFTSDLGQTKENPFYNYLIRKSLNLDNHGDREHLVNYFVDQASKYSSEEQHNPQLDKTKKILRDIKSVISSFLSEDKIRSLAPHGI